MRAERSIMANPLVAFWMNLRQRRLSQYLARHGRMLTVSISESETVDDEPQHPTPDQRYIHAILAVWTDPKSGKAYEFRTSFRSLRATAFRTGDLAKVLIDPNNFRRYQVQV